MGCFGIDCCFTNTVRLDRIVSILSGIQVIRALWQVWGVFDNDWLASVSPIIMPMVYLSCILSVFLMAISVWTTWSVYKAQLRSLQISWWIYYSLTVLCFFNGCASLAAVCITKDQFIAGCMSENTVLSSITCDHCDDVRAPCIRRWEETIARSAISMIMDLLMNAVFAYAVYRCRLKQGSLRSGHGQIRPAPPPPYNIPRNDFDEDGFQVVELK